MTILLTIDVEEFDTPLDYGKNLSFDEQIDASRRGVEQILLILERESIVATFFCTAVFAMQCPSLIKRVVSAGHEIASHGYYHSHVDTAHLKESRIALEQISLTPVVGFRMPRMMDIDEREVFNAGYRYNSSLNPTFIPGRYNNFSKPRTIHYHNGGLHIPASVTPWFRIPLFWLTFHHLPLFLYKFLSKKTIQRDGYLHLYFHPWEFIDLSDRERYGCPSYIQKNTGDKMIARLHDFITWCKQNDFEFATLSSYLSDKL